MPQSGRRALIASGSREGFSRNRALLESAGLEITGWAKDGISALAQLQNPTDILLTDMALPMLDGAALAERVSTANLAVHPGVIVVPLGHIPEAIVRRITSVGGQALSSPDMLAYALEAVRPENRPCPSSVAQKCSALLNRLGMPEHVGRKYLECAVLLAYMDRRLADSLMGTLYPMAAAKFSVTVRQAERAMRYVIERTWQNGAVDAQYALFQGTIDAERGKPTCGQMVALLADILRLEG